MSKSTSKLFEEENPKPMQDEDMNTPVDDEVKSDLPEVISENQAVDDEDEIKDVKIDVSKRKKFRINGNNDAILELDTTDLNISHRLNDAYDKLNKMMDEVKDKLDGIPDNDDDVTDDDTRTVGDALKMLDTNMREQVDYIFDAPVSEICLPHGSMYSPHNGMFNYEYIIDAVTSLYETDLNKEFTLMRKRVAARTEKYTRGKSPTKKYAKH